MSEKVEKVRGMNAALAETKVGGLTEREPPRLHLTRRQIALAALLAVIGVLAAIYTIDEVTTGQKTFSAVVSASKVYDLNFANSGTVTALDVHPGQRVSTGQVLATQDASRLRQTVQQLQQTVKDDQAAVASASDPQLSSAQVQQDSLEVQQAQTALTDAQAALATAQSSGQATVAAATQTAQGDEALVTSDASRYHAACPSGPVAPAAGLGSVEQQAAEATFQNCLHLQDQMDRDQATVSSAEAQVSAAEAAAQQAGATAQGNVNAAQSALGVAENAQPLQSAPGDASTMATAEGQLSTAEGQLSAAQQQLQQATITSPDDALVAEVYGSVGEILGPDGVRQYQNPAALPANEAPSFQLFPTQPAPQSSSSSSGAEPVIQLIAGTQQITAEVPESELSTMTVGHRAEVIISATKQKVPATVAEVVLSPSRSSDAVNYDVILNLDRSVSGLVPGMSATVRSA